MVPLSAETGGRFDGAFSNFLKEVVTSGLDFGESPLHLQLANALIYGSKTIARYPVREAVGLVDI